MFIVEDFRHAPMRTLATAETFEEAKRAADALGITGHEFIRSVNGGMADAVDALESRTALLFNLSDAEDRASDAERKKDESERENDRLHDRISGLRVELATSLARLSDVEKVAAHLREISQPSLPTEAA